MFFFLNNNNFQLNFIVCIYQTPPPQPGCDRRSMYNPCKADLNSELFSLTKAKEPNLSDY